MMGEAVAVGVLCQLEWRNRGARGFKARIPGGRRIQDENLRRIQGKICHSQTHGSCLLRCYDNLQNESIRGVRSETAGATGGARDGNSPNALPRLLHKVLRVCVFRSAVLCSLI